MIHKLFELDKMNREQLESIANDLNIKGIKKLDNENLAYQILDAEAREESVKPSVTAEKPKARRGRPAKAKAPEAEAPKEAAPAPEPAQEAKPRSAKSRKPGFLMKLTEKLKDWHRSRFCFNRSMNLTSV